MSGGKNNEKISLQTVANFVFLFFSLKDLKEEKLEIDGNYQKSEVDVIKYSDNQAVFETRNDQPGILVIND